ncbi:MAG: hypothetical protein ACI8Q1_001748 [Parvicella sp.]|jgi:hypothetical protein
MLLAMNRIKILIVGGRFAITLDQLEEFNGCTDLIGGEYIN